MGCASGADEGPDDPSAQGGGQRTGQDPVRPGSAGAGASGQLQRHRQRQQQHGHQLCLGDYRRLRRRPDHVQRTGFGKCLPAGQPVRAGQLRWDADPTAGTVHAELRAEPIPETATADLPATWQ